MIAFTILLKQGLLYPKHFLAGRLKKTTATKESLQQGEGAIIAIKGEKVAAYKKSNEELITFSAVCTHMGCIVGWNPADKTWDCPCHGSRYEADGRVKRGPTKKDLIKVVI